MTRLVSQHLGIAQVAIVRQAKSHRNVVAKRLQQDAIIEGRSRRSACAKC